MTAQTRDPALLRVSATEPETREGDEWVVRPFTNLTGIRIGKAIAAADVPDTQEFKDWWQSEVASRIRQVEGGGSYSIKFDNTDEQMRAWYALRNVQILQQAADVDVHLTRADGGRWQATSEGKTATHQDPLCAILKVNGWLP